jgi:hypothetical protein
LGTCSPKSTWDSTAQVNGGSPSNGRSGQSEATVKVIQKLLHPFIYQDQDWEELLTLPTLEFPYNDTKQLITRETPFYLNYGFHPTGATRHEVVSNPHAEDHIQYLPRLQEAAKGPIADVQQIQQRHANLHRSEVAIIKEGDWVQLLQWKQGEKRKLAPITDDPFKVIKVGINTVTLKFQSNSRAHPTINISRV